MGICLCKPRGGRRRRLFRRNDGTHNGTHNNDNNNDDGNDVIDGGQLVFQSNESSIGSRHRLDPLHPPHHHLTSSTNQSDTTGNRSDSGRQHHQQHGHSTLHTHSTSHTHHTLASLSTHGHHRGRLSNSFYAALVRERHDEHDFYGTYQVLNEIAQTKMSRIFRIRKWADSIDTSSQDGVFQTSTSHTNNTTNNNINNNTGGGNNNINNHYSSGSTNLRVLRQRYEQAFSRKRPGIFDDRGSWNNNGSSRYFALKAINLDMVNDSQMDQLKREIEILKVLDHKNIINAYESFSMPSVHRFLIVMELCTGGDMYARMPHTEQLVASVMRQVMSAVDYMHAKNIIHRDIKMENIVWESHNVNNWSIRMIDFGLSKWFPPKDRVFTQRVGSLYSMSPETMKGIYTTQADLWSIGVCAYIMLSNGNKPFEGATPKEMVANVLQGYYTFSSPSSTTTTIATTTTTTIDDNDNQNKNDNKDDDDDDDVWTNISDLAKSFISQLLVLDPDDRLTAFTAKHHKWFYYYIPELGCLNQSFHGSSGVRYKINSAITRTKTKRQLASSFDDVVDDDDNNENDDIDDKDQYDNNSSCDGNRSQKSDDKDKDKDHTEVSSFVSEEFKKRALTNVLQFANNMGDFRRLILNVVAQRSTSAQEVSQLRAVFEDLNTLNAGTISYGEFKAALVQWSSSNDDNNDDDKTNNNNNLKYNKCTEEDIRKAFRKVNVNRNRVINYTEFLAATLETLGTIEEYRLAEAFALMDCSDSGSITRDDLFDLMGDLLLGYKDGGERYIDQIMAEGDLTNDGQITYNEFVQYFYQSKKTATSVMNNPCVLQQQTQSVVDSKLPNQQQQPTSKNTSNLVQSTDVTPQHALRASLGSPGELAGHISFKGEDQHPGEVVPTDHFLKSEEAQSGKSTIPFSNDEDPNQPRYQDILLDGVQVVCSKGDFEKEVAALDGQALEFSNSAHPEAVVLLDNTVEEGVGWTVEQESTKGSDLPDVATLDEVSLGAPIQERNEANDDLESQQELELEEFCYAVGNDETTALLDGVYNATWTDASMDLWDNEVPQEDIYIEEEPPEYRGTYSGRFYWRLRWYERFRKDC